MGRRPGSSFFFSLMAIRSAPGRVPRRTLRRKLVEKERPAYLNGRRYAGVVIRAAADRAKRPTFEQQSRRDMPHTIRQTPDYVEIVLSGDIQGTDILQAIRALRAMPPETWSYPRLWDMRSITSMDLDPDHYHAFVAERKALHEEREGIPTKYAVVAVREMDRELAEVITLIFRPLGWETEFFEDIDEARAWVVG